MSKNPVVFLSGRRSKAGRITIPSFVSVCVCAKRGCNKCTNQTDRN